MSAGAEIVNIAGGGGCGGGVDVVLVTVTVKDAGGVELPSASCAMQVTV